MTKPIKPGEFGAAPMTRAKLKQAAQLIWGPRYVSEMARALGIHIATAQRWDDGRTPTIPDWVEGKIVSLLAKRRNEIDKMMAKLKGAG
jgi:hypothetical protein